MAKWFWMEETQKPDFFQKRTQPRRKEGRVGKVCRLKGQEMGGTEALGWIFDTWSVLYPS